MEDGTETLQAYARLILPLSVNGIVEGFAHAVMNEREIKKHGNAWLVSCSFVNCALGFSLLKYSRIGAAGLVYGNFISLMMRIYLTSRFLIRTGKLSSTIFRNVAENQDASSPAVHFRVDGNKGRYKWKKDCRNDAKL